jgi:hypothetical protein
LQSDSRCQPTLRGSLKREIVGYSCGMPATPFLGLLPLALASFLLVRNWTGWADPLVDFGRELYIPWRLAEGQVLYRDIAYLDGPLSPYWNTLCFTLFPVSMRTLELSNLGVIAAVCALIFALLRRLARTDHAARSDAPVALAGVTVFVGIFAFNLIGTGGNMNWVTPYSHGITHGVALGLAALWCLARHLTSGGRLDLMGAGFSLGLVALTKPEVFVGAGLAVGVGFAASLRSPPPGADPPLRRAAALAAAALVPVAIAVGLLAQAMPFSAAVSGALGGWAHLVASDVSNLHFYRRVMGIDVPLANLARTALALGVWASVIVPAGALALAPANPRLRHAFSLAAPLVVLAVAPWVGGLYAWDEILRPLFAFLAVFACFAAVGVWRLRAQQDAPRAILLLSLSLFALALLPKIFLNPNLEGYAFALAVPGVTVLVLALLHLAPVAIERRGGDPRIFRRTSVALLALVTIGCLQFSDYNRRDKTVVVGEGGDRFIARPDRLADPVRKLAIWVDQKLPPDATLLVMPEGVIVNYLARRIDPTPHVNFLPPELAIYGEERILADLRANPPDFVALVQRDTLEYGLPLFGTDYGQALFAWLQDDYELLMRIGKPALRPGRLEDRLGRWEVLGRRRAPAHWIRNSPTTP